MNMSLEFVGLTLISLLLIYKLFNRKESIILFSSISIFSILLISLPLGHTPTRMIITHIGMLTLMGGLLYSAYDQLKDNSVERVMAYVIFISILVIKFFGFIGIGIFQERFRVAYFLGYIVFLTVCFLINQLVFYQLSKKKINFPSGIINGISAFLVFFNIYALSFETNSQESIFNAESIVIIMLSLFISLAVLLYIFLWKKVEEKILLILSGIICVSSTTVLLLTGPNVNWIFYSVIFNILLFIITGAFIYFSIKKHSKSILNFAIAGFVIHILTRYFDLFWDMLSGSLLFLTTSLLLFAGAWIIEKNRRRLLNKINES